MNTDSLFGEYLSNPISQETYRQRLNELAKDERLSPEIDDSIVRFLSGVSHEKYVFEGKEYYPLDIDVIPLINPNVKKEGISCTYKKKNGYAPIMAYLGHYAICFDLREGKQHCEKDAPEFLDRCADILTKIGIKLTDVLVWVDSGHDASDFILPAKKIFPSHLVRHPLFSASSPQHDQRRSLALRSALRV